MPATETRILSELQKRKNDIEQRRQLEVWAMNFKQVWAKNIQQTASWKLKRSP